MNFKKPDMKSRLAQAGFLFKNSFTIVGQNRELIRPVIGMVVYSAVMILLFFIAITLMVVEGSGSLWFLLAGAAMFIYKFFFYSRAKAVLSRMTWTAATGGTPNHSNARGEVKELKRQIRILALLDMVGAWVASRRKKSTGFMGLLLGGLVEVWDLVNHFLLPAFAIDKLSMSEGIAKLKGLQDHVPQTLGGVFGIDIMGGVVRTLMAPIHALMILGSLIIGLLCGHRMPEAFSGGSLGEILPDMGQIWIIGPDTVFSMLPVLIAITMGILLHSVFSRIIEAVKVIYFTLFYARIEHADELAPNISADLDSYLVLDKDAALAT